MNRTRITRRGVLKGGLWAAASAPYVLSGASVFGQSAPAASERINVGFIGPGHKGFGHFRGLLRNGRVRMIAMCDVKAGVRARCASTAKGAYDLQHRFPTYNDFEDLLARDDIDAVVIATPDHWHAPLAIAAARAGKDIYCEKPMSLTIRGAQEMVRAVREAGVVFQTGSQQRSSGSFLRACELVRNGYIGEVKKVHVGLPWGTSRYCNLPGEPVPEGVDWDRWLGPAPKVPYHRERISGSYSGGWRKWRDYSGGGITDWGAHHLDICQWGLGMDGSGPVEIVPACEKSVEHTTLRYASGVEVALTGPRGVEFIGTEGRVFVSRRRLETTPSSLRRVEPGADETHLQRSGDHTGNWLDCIKTRRRAICDVEIGASSATVCHLVNISLWLGRPVRWDPSARRFEGDAEADAMRDRARREPWRL